MSLEGVERKLAAFLSADVVGFSRLMTEDDQATVQTLEAYREVIANLIERHEGRVVDAVGDNLLAEFRSVVEALTCAVEIQRELADQSVDIPDSKRMRFRIGVHLGDVVSDGAKIYGDGVNIAARLEALADPGGICISGTVYEQIRRKLPHAYEDMGEQSLKNIADPVRVFRVRLDSQPTPIQPAREASGRRSIDPLEEAAIQTRELTQGLITGGVITVASGIGLALFLAQLDKPGLWTVGFIPGVVGLGMIAAAKILDRRAGLSTR